MDSKVGQLQRLLNEGANFTFSNFSIRSVGGQKEHGGEDSAEWLVWKTRISNTIKAALEDNSAPVALLQSAIGFPTKGYSEDAFARQKSMMMAAVQQTMQILQDDTFGESKWPKSASSSSILSNRVFVVHGHDHSAKTELEVFLKDLGVDPVVLHREPDQGRTLIEKFEHHSDVGFAFILLTADDIAYSADQDSSPDSDRKKELRARPNVIFEFGYFVGKLGRQRVCCLIKGDVKRPSDIDGLVYKQVSPSIEAIGLSIIKELKAAGYVIKI